MNPLVIMFLQRMGLGLLTLFAITVVIFLAVELLPGDIAQELLGQNATPETVAALRDELGMNLPPLTRYLEWLGNAAQGDLGKSLASGREISELIGQRFLNTLALAAYAAAISIPMAVFLGLLAALYRNSVFDRAINISTLSAISFPEYFIGYILMLLLSVKAGWFPSLANMAGGGSLGDFLYRTFLPMLTLVLVVTAHMMRMTRASIINLLAQPYIEMARLKGVSAFRIILHHALPNALAPIINVIAINAAYLMAGVVLVEVVFAYPGLGQLMVDSVSKRDITVVQACCLIFATVYILLNLTADVLSIATNPRLMHRK
ncbi:ABC transporter permease [Pseudomonas benzenivorans]|uniref:ABC transporter permease n=1 Tax=Pseudomonas benzenivorans TaxID=556533 RepID=A0ABY5H872_9PSED|nr:ABC transporter permease [Pseudomonas benzenivorans]UTW08219.1 ABC transporter permease [Pseudomonas benzenivorans]